MAYWRRSAPQMQAATELVAAEASVSAPARPAKAPRPRMMRQYDLVERVRSYNPDTDEDLLNRAYVYAMKAHGAQTRASGDPYFSHPLEVAAILTDLKLDDATIVAALLHDTIEDTEATRAEIDKLFGPEIARAAVGLAGAERQPSPNPSSWAATSTSRQLTSTCTTRLSTWARPTPRTQSDRHSQRLLDWGLVEAYRRFHPEAGKFTWWDYRARATFTRAWECGSITCW